MATATLYSLSSSLAGITTGLLFGASRALLSPALRVALASSLAIIGVILGGFELSGRRLRPFQLDRETPHRWLDAGPVWWAIRNGVALGSGVTTRIGFWLWYAVPIASFLIGRLEFGMLITAPTARCGA